MPDILDEQIEIGQRDESKINKITGYLRYIVCGYLFVILLKDLLPMLNQSSFLSKESLVTDLITILVFILLLGWFFYHNYKHARLELKNKLVQPHFKFFAISCFILFNLLMIWKFSQPALKYIIEFGLGKNSLSLLILSIMLLLITFREFNYLVRIYQARN